MAALIKQYESAAKDFGIREDDEGFLFTYFLLIGEAISPFSVIFISICKEC